MDSAWLYASPWLLFSFTMMIVWKLFKRSTRLSYPPGPTPLPFIGSVYDVPSDPQWIGYSSLFKKHGSRYLHQSGLALLTDSTGYVLFMQVLGNPLLILGSVDAAIDLLERRSAIYSDRPQTKMMSLYVYAIIFQHLILTHRLSIRKNELGLALCLSTVWCALARSPAYVPPILQCCRSGEPDRFVRTTASEVPAQPFTATRGVLESHTIVRASARSLRSLCELFAHSLSGASIFKATYGTEIADSSHPYLHAAEESMKGLSEALIPGRFWIDFVPIPMYLLSWMPYATFQKIAAYYKPFIFALRETPWKDAYDVWVSGIFDIFVHRYCDH